MRIRNGYQSVVRPGRYVHHRPAWCDFTYFGHLKLELDALVEPLLTEAVHGWRAGHSVQTAIDRITSMTGTLVALDIVDYFPNVDQERLGALVRREFPKGDWYWTRIRACLPDSGLPDGAAWSPSLANLYLTTLDAEFPTLTRYGDNIAVAVEHHADVRRVAGRLRRSLNEIGLTTHEHQIGGVVFCNQVLKSLPGGRIIHKGRRCD